MHISEAVKITTVSFSDQRNIGITKQIYLKRTWPIHLIPFEADYMQIFAAANTSLIPLKTTLIMKRNHVVRLHRILINLIKLIKIRKKKFFFTNKNILNSPIPLISSSLIFLERYYYWFCQLNQRWIWLLK